LTGRKIARELTAKAISRKPRCFHEHADDVIRSDTSEASQAADDPDSSWKFSRRLLAAYLSAQRCGVGRGEMAMKLED